METTQVLGLPARDATLVDLLRARAEREPHRKAFGFVTEDTVALPDGSRADVEIDIAYAALDRRARAIAHAVRDHGLERRPVVLLYPPGLDYIAAVYGCFYAGAYAVPAYPPEPTRLARSLPRLVAMVVDSGAKAVLTTRALCAMRATVIELAPALAGLTFIATDTIDDAEAASWRDRSRSPSDIAFLQYTSGSTGDPKGVVLTHENLLHNMAAIREHARLTPDVVGVSWLPPYHDMGLIGFILAPVFCGLPVVHLSPMRFLNDPGAWLSAITRHQAGISAAPNFAFDVCARRVTGAQKGHLDLRSWKLALSGAEPVRPATLDRFARAFAECGFEASSYRPVYGLAESSLLVSFPRADTSPRLLRVDPHALRRDVVLEVPDLESGLVLVSCGATVLGQGIAIVHPERRVPLPSGNVGEIWLESRSVARGYWRNPEETDATFGVELDAAVAGDAAARSRWMRTGDLGFLHEEELFITGRLKDLIVINGRNHYPQDIEATVEGCHPSIRAGCAAAFISDDPAFAADDERLVIVAEIDEKRAIGIERTRIEGDIRHAVSRDHALYVHAVVLVARGSISKTSSGKIRRRTCRRLWRDGALEVIALDEVEVNIGRRAPSSLSRARWISLPPSARADALIAHLRDLVRTTLSLDEEEVPADRPLYSLGLDSVAAMQLKAELEGITGSTLPLGSAFEGPSIEALVHSVLAPPVREPFAVVHEERRAPGPAGDALVGSLGALQDDPFAFLLEMRRRYGEVVRLRLGPWEAHLVTQPAHIQRVLKDDVASFVKASNYDNQSLLTGEGLISAEGDEWRAQRDVALGAFHGRAMSRLTNEVLPLVIDDVVRTLEDRVGCAVNVNLVTKRLTLRAICLSLFGYDIRARMDEVLEALDGIAAFGWDDMTAFLAGTFLTREETLRRHMEVIDDVLFAIIDAGAPHGTLLAVLEQDCRSRSGAAWRPRLRDQMLTYLLAGHDTTAGALAFALIALADRPDVDEAVAAEACALAHVQDASVGALPFTQATIREVLRLWPPAWLFTRKATRDVEIGEWRVREGSLVLLSPFVTHRDPFLWHEPSAFRPERFLARSSATRDAEEERPEGFAYFPFGGGARSCIGAGLALAELRAVLCSLARRFRFVRPGGTAREVTLMSRVTLAPSVTTLLVVERRNERPCSSSVTSRPNGARS